MSVFKNIFRKILCKLGRHEYKEDNEGIYHIRNFFAFSYYGCIHCNKYKITFSNPIDPMFLRAIVKHKKDFEAELLRRKVLFEKTPKPTGRELYSLSLATGEVTTRILSENENTDSFYGFYDYGYNAFEINDDRMKTETETIVTRTPHPFDI